MDEETPTAVKYEKVNHDLNRQVHQQPCPRKGQVYVLRAQLVLRGIIVIDALRKRR